MAYLDRTPAARPFPLDRADAIRARSISSPPTIVRDESPLQMETGLDALGSSTHTPNDLFFVRSHFPEPRIDPATWRLEVEGLVHESCSLPLGRLRGLRHVEATHTLECAGNGRGLFADPSPGIAWEHGAVGTAAWGGLRLRDVLQLAGVKPEARHVWLEGGDRPTPGQAPFVRSIPIEKALDDVLIVSSMNGQPLSAHHGAPVRAIVPGWYGMASVKWLQRIRVESVPCDGAWMSRAYRYVYPTGERSVSMAVDEMRVKSLITSPSSGARLPRGFTNVLGFAWAGVANVRCVDVSCDGGRTWRQARFSSEAAPMAWRRWEAGFHLLEPGPTVIMARATDAWGVTQPASARFNSHGYGNNSIQRIAVEIV